jgi:NifU-like protein
LAEIEDLIAAVQVEKASIAKVAADIAQNQASGKPLTNLQKITLIQQVLQEVRPVLVTDGGDVELYDVDGDRVLVTLKGACGSCASSTATLKGAIETRLKERISPSIFVEAVN